MSSAPSRSAMVRATRSNPVVAPGGEAHAVKGALASAPPRRRPERQNCPGNAVRGHLGVAGDGRARKAPELALPGCGPPGPGSAAEDSVRGPAAHGLILHRGHRPHGGRSGPAGGRRSSGRTWSTSRSEQRAPARRGGPASRSGRGSWRTPAGTGRAGAASRRPGPR